MACFPFPAYAGTDRADVRADVNFMDKSLCSVLLALFLISITAIAVLSFFLWQYKCKLRRNREYLASYISGYLELKNIIPPAERPLPVKRPKDIPYTETINIIQNMLKRLMLLPLLLLTALPLAAQEKADSVYEFRFVPEKDMFFIPYGNNQTELERLSAVVRQNHEAIAEGKVPVYVDGYCNSLSGEAENLAIARLRSNRVKSALILHGQLKEEYFVTRNHAEKGDWVTVRIRLAASPERKAEETETETATAEKEEIQAVSTAGTVPETVAETDTTEPLKDETAKEVVLPEAAMHNVYGFALRANLLRWATLTPDLGIEWRIDHNFGILVGGSWTSWSWSDKDRRYALWKVSPEVRYYIGKEKRGFLGAMYHLGEFNYKLGDTGKQGDYQGGGITGGYTLELNRALSLDFHAALGYTYADYDKYKVIDGIRVRTGSDTKNYWGINQLGVTLVWFLN